MGLGSWLGETKPNPNPDRPHACRRLSLVSFAEACAPLITPSLTRLRPSKSDLFPDSLLPFGRVPTTESARRSASCTWLGLGLGLGSG